jgi:tRNA 2-selenouridine synthase
VTELPFHRERPDRMVETPIALAALREFDAVIDARSPAEFAEDHLPGAINAPVLDDAERALVGTIYKQQSAFEAKRVGAPLVSRNIAGHLDTLFAGKPRGWRPLVYCWRGGGRSGALTHVLRQVGWDAHRLEGGYKAFRRQVVADLERLPAEFTFHVICGATGSGKSRLLEALGPAGAQVLDLEVLAAHRGSVLGELPDAPQPSQKHFETRIWSALSGFDRARVVFVESESKKVGNLRVTDALIERMRASRCWRIETETRLRVDLLMEDYAHFVADPAALAAKLDLLRALHGAERIDLWKEHLAAGRWRVLVADLLESHYDPAYRRSLDRNYRDTASAAPIVVSDISAAGFAALAAGLARSHGGKSSARGSMG